MRKLNEMKQISIYSEGTDEYVVNTEVQNDELMSYLDNFGCYDIEDIHHIKFDYYYSNMRTVSIPLETDFNFINSTHFASDNYIKINVSVRLKNFEVFDFDFYRTIELNLI